MDRNKKKKHVIKCGRIKRCTSVSTLLEENNRLKEQIKEKDAMIDDLRRDLYKKKKKDRNCEEKIPKKKGAPIGHLGKTRAKPDHIDEEIQVVPDICPYCGSKDLFNTGIIEEHIQEDIVLPKKKVTKYIKTVCKCNKCNMLVRKTGFGEMPGSYIGPQTKSILNHLRYDIGISNHKLQRIFKDLFDMPFHQTSVGGFENQLTRRGQSIYNQMRIALKEMNLLYIDETGWKRDGLPYWLWGFCNKRMAYYHIDESRGGNVIESLLGKTFTGTIISDFLSAYNAIESFKQKCLVHLLRMIDRWDMRFGNIKEVEMFFEQLKEHTKRIIYLFKNRRRVESYIDQRADIIAKIRNLLGKELPHKKVDTWRLKTEKQQDNLYRCLFNPKIDFNNNFAERILRPSVIMRKITFCNRSDNGIHNHSVIMSLLETAKLNNKYPQQIFYRILTNPEQISFSKLINPP